ncbi:Inactive phospholipase D5 [Galemys pyrenaicus]|uniref:Inactive phospholipase D5 n=1 Tax=Galemys pyrenaicus TaxID=202257 RepID=A0A8J6DVI7_GALPY|nr:Inactive phospholipase D5 [Galemys pyrenaicus]
MPSPRLPRRVDPSPAPARSLCALLPRAHTEPAACRPPPGHVRMEIRQHEWLSASPHEGFEQMRLKSRPKEPSPSLTRVGANFYSSVKQQDYSASVWLRRKDKLEHVRAASTLGPRSLTCRTHTHLSPVVA